MIKLKLRDIDQRLGNSQKAGHGNVIILNGSYVGAGEYITYHGNSGQSKEESSFCLGQIISIEDYRDIPRLERTACRLPRCSGNARFILVRCIETKDRLCHPEMNLEQYNNLPKMLPEAIPTCKLCFIAVEQVQSVAFLFRVMTSSLENSTLVALCMVML